jgi:hypothetical protein
MKDEVFSLCVSLLLNFGSIYIPVYAPLAEFNLINTAVFLKIMFEGKQPFL